ncbi:MAG: YbjN domain-containing protein [Myxococcales bacterium]|nr:YbjN domain-containing protein [Myxococcota bacterium]MDW8282584.1 YbjN domain-containing protein [Myxococcales bacterium]
MAPSAPGPPPTSVPAIERTCGLIERTLGPSNAFRKVDTGLYVVKQGSSYVMIAVMASGPKQDRALVRVTAQVVSGVRAEPSLFRQLLILNGTLRFGAFAYVPEGEIVLFTHTLLGGSTLDPNELVAAVHDVALVADSYDDRIVARYGGRRMQDIVEESALHRLLNPEEPDPLALPGEEAPASADSNQPGEEAPAPANHRPQSGETTRSKRSRGHAR